MSREQKQASPIRNFFDGIAEKLMTVNSDIDDDYGDDDYDSDVNGYEEPVPAPQRPSASYATGRSSAHPSEKQPNNNVIKFNRENIPQKSVEITDPANVEEAARCVDYLLQGIIVTVNLENVDESEKQRVADFICGASYAAGAVIRRISAHIFIITPTGVGISGGLKDETVPAVSAKYELPRVASYR